MKIIFKSYYDTIGKWVITLLLFCFTPVVTGQLVVQPSSSIIQDISGTPFLWLGDTAWELFHILDREEACKYLDNRKEKGFTVIQAVILAELEGLDQPNAYGDCPLINRDPATPNDNYFRHVDFILQEATKRGLYIGLVPTWANNVVTAENQEPIFTTENALTYGRFLGERYKDQKVVWILGGDRNVHNEEEYHIWMAMAEGIRQGDKGKHLMSYHPTGDISSHYWFHNEPWLSFNIVQSGHYHKFDAIYRYAGTYSQLHPRKPFVNAEPAYEDIAVRFWEYYDYAEFGKKKEDVIGEDGLIKDKDYFTLGFFEDYDVRMAAYWTFFSGAAGFTYGNNAIWQMYKPGGNYHVPCLTYWEEAMDRPGAEQMRYVCQLFMTYPLGSFIPDLSAVYDINLNNENHIPALVGNDNSFLMAYLNKGQTVKIYMPKLSGQARGYWFDPRTGNRQDIGLYENTGIRSFTPPVAETYHGNDWILILDTALSR